MAHTPKFRRFIWLLQQARRANLMIAGCPPPLSKDKGYWTRRRVLKTAAVASAAGLASGGCAIPRQTLVFPRPHPTIAVVGGGLAGLNAAYQLHKWGLPVTVYEASNRLGGRIMSVTYALADDAVLELGGALINTDHDDMLGLVKEFGLTLVNRRADTEYQPFPETGYYFAGRAWSEAEIAVCLRPLAHQLSIDAALLNEAPERFMPIFDHLSVAAYLDLHADKVSASFIRDLIENVIRAEYGVEPHESSAVELLFTLPTVSGKQVEMLGPSDETFVVQGGNGRLIDQLAAALTERVRLRMQLKQIQADGDGFRLTFALPGSRYEVIAADYVILAIPFPIVRHIDLRVELPEPLWHFIREGGLGANEKLVAGFSDKVWREPQGFVRQAWTDLGFCQVWEAFQCPGDSAGGALTFFLGGREVCADSFARVEAQGRRFVSRLDTVIPGIKEATTGQYVRSRWTHNRFITGSYATFKPGQLTAFGDYFYIEADDPAERQDVHVGNLVFAGEHLSDAFYGYMNGAAQTGRLAAEVIVRRIQKAAPMRNFPAQKVVFDSSSRTVSQMDVVGLG